ncbi:MAG: toll/interleukin-1 receptor domain-containing protein, partial [Clostridia bacterium]|nr:toll/interleukin-1 receptor domain-containing protein [Clostridia bacterium]
MRCARCKSKDVRKFEDSMNGFCAVCNSVVEIEYEDTQEKQSMQIFFSYGHDTHQDFVRRLADAIMRKTNGRIKVWIDKEDIREHTNWRERITDGILNSRSVLAFLSQYSAREKGVCLDELAIALSSKHGMIKTVLLERADTFTPPALVTEYQWADMSNYHEFAEKGEEAFAEYIDRQADRIITMLDSDEVTQYNNELSLLRKKLALPEISYEQPRLNRLLKTEMVGRTWLTDRVNAWIEDTAAKPVLMLYGKPGAGKSMFSAHLQHYNPHVAASFACNHQSDEFSDTDKIITWLAYKLAMRLPDYRRQLLKLFDDPHFDTGTKHDRFDRLIAQPLSLCIDGNRAPMMIIIDALDEAKGDEMAGFISEYSQLLPPWLRMLITARKEPHITERFKTYPHIDLAEEREHNEADIREYYTLKLCSLLTTQTDSEAALQRLLHASEGVFLYAEEICPILLEEAKKGDLDLLTFDLPKGMDNLFHFSMKRKDFTYHKDGMTYHYTDFWQEPLGMIVAAPSPLPIATLKSLIGWDENDLHAFRLPLSALLTETDGCLQTFHRSFGEWLDKTGEFRSSTQDGLVNLANRAFAVYQTGVDNLDEFLLCNLTLLLRKANLQDAYQTATADDVLIDAMDDKAYELIEYSQLEAALQLCEELVCIFEDDTSEKGMTNYSAALDRLGHVLQIKNAFARATQVFNKALQTDRQLSKDFPENPKYRRDLSVSLIKVADILKAQNEWDEALKYYNESLEIDRKLTADFSENPLYRCDLSVSLIKVAGILQAQNEWDKALKLFNESLEIDRKLTEDFLENPDYRRDLSVSLNNVAYILQAQNEWDEALELYTESLEIARKLAADFPENPRYRRDLSVLLNNVADILQAQNEWDEALELNTESLEIARKLATDFPEHPGYRRDLSVSLNKVAYILQAQNKSNEALELYTES